MTNELKPCPFCGSQPFESDCCNTYRITCTDDDCPACNDNWFESEEDAIERWNKRTYSVKMASKALFNASKEGLLR